MVGRNDWAAHAQPRQVQIVRDGLQRQDRAIQHDGHSDLLGRAVRHRACDCSGSYLGKVEGREPQRVFMMLLPRPAE
ncbi:MAG: hypothetical protein QOJ02_3184 [Acidobacteriota bacterium]|nr:hypothetical protein [Acidobacteriota bacterium]